MNNETKESFKEEVLKVLKEIPDLKQWKISEQIKEDLKRRGEHKKEVEKLREHEVSVLNERKDLISKRFKEVEDFYENFKIPCKVCNQLNKVHFGFFRGNVSTPMFILGFSECKRHGIYVKNKELDGDYNSTITTFCLPVNCDLKDLSETVFSKYFSTMIDKQKRNKLFQKIKPIKIHLE